MGGLGFASQAGQISVASRPYAAKLGLAIHYIPVHAFGVILRLVYQYNKNLIFLVFNICLMKTQHKVSYIYSKKLA